MKTLANIYFAFIAIILIAIPTFGLDVRVVTP